jgi:hypothetical protein
MGIIRDNQGFVGYPQSQEFVAHQMVFGVLRKAGNGSARTPSRRRIHEAQSDASKVVNEGKLE